MKEAGSFRPIGSPEHDRRNSLKNLIRTINILLAGWENDGIPYGHHSIALTLRLDVDKVVQEFNL